MPKQQVIVIHGGTTFATQDEYIHFLQSAPIELDRLRAKNDWKAFLQDKLGGSFDVFQPKMPNSTNAQYEEWKVWFERIASLLNENVILVGHSLGGLFLAKYLSENIFAKKIKGLFLIAAPYDTTEMDESLGSFEITHSLGNIQSQTSTIYLYYSKDDVVVPFIHSRLYKDKISTAIVRVFEDRRHFKQEEFEELVDDIIHC